MVTQEPTCTESGERERYCEICGELLDTETIPALGHDWSPWEVVTEPTTTETGLKQRVCARCGLAETEVIPVHVHTPGDWVVTQEPTCTEPGARVRYCTGCGVAVDSEELPALGHDYTDAVAPPTCTEDGYTTHTCSRCGDAYTDSTVPALGHDFVNGICTRCGAEDPDNPPVTSVTATVTIAAPADWHNEETETSEITANRTYRFVCSIREWRDDVIVTRLTVNGTEVAVTGEKIGNNPGHYVYTSEPFTVAGDITILARLNGGPDAVSGYEFVQTRSVPASTRAASTLRKGAALSVQSADAPIAEAEDPPQRGHTPAARSVDYPVEMTSEALQIYLTDQGAVPYGDEFTVTRAEGWSKVISNLPKREGYKEYTYYVVELDSEGDGYHLVGYDGEGTDQITATNQTRPTSFELPRTGGTGTSRYTFSGLILMLAASVLAYTKLRRRKPRSRGGGPDG